MGRPLCSLILALFSLHCTGQDRFFSFVGGWMNNIGVEYDGQCRVIGLQSTAVPSEHLLIVNNLNDDGTIESQSTFDVDTVASTTLRAQSSASLMLNDSILLIAGQLSEGGQFYGVLYTYNLGTEVFDVMSTYDLATYTAFFTIEQFTDTSFLVLGWQFDNGSPRTSRVNLMANDGTLIWTSSLLAAGGSDHHSYPIDVVQLSNGTIAALLWELNNSPPNSNEQYWRVRLTVLDDQGQILWDQYPGDPVNNRVRAGAMVEQDGEILVAFSEPFYYGEDGDPVPVTHKVQFERYALDGQLQSNDSLVVGPDDPPVQWQVNQLSFLEDGNLIIAGSHVLEAGFMAKVTPDLETIWYYPYTPHEYEEGEFPTFQTDIYNVIELSDNGLLCTGKFESQPNELYPYGYQTAIALKVDEHGCLVEQCEVGLEEHFIGGLKAWPNPAEDFITIEIPDLMQDSGALVYEVSDMLGVRRLSGSFGQGDMARLDLSGSGPGMYLLKLSTGAVYSTTKFIVR